MAREIDETGADDVLASSWSPLIPIRIYLPENIDPVAKAEAGIFINGQGIFSDILKSAKTGEEITYSGASSYDPDGDDSKLEYSWSIVNGQGFSINLLGDKNAKTFNKIYNTPGTYIAILTVTDERGGFATWQATVTVSDSGVNRGDGEEDGYSTTMLAGIAGVAVIALAGLAMGLRRMGGSGDDFEGEFRPLAVFVLLWRQQGSLVLGCRLWCM